LDELDGAFFGHGLHHTMQELAMQAQAYNHALQWLDKQKPAPLALAMAPMTHSIECNELCTLTQVFSCFPAARFQRLASSLRRYMWAENVSA
jgi:hypothetical protein